MCIRDRYWTGDHYEKVACNAKPNGRNIIPFKEDQFAVQKINKEDTIGRHHINKLFYIKDQNDIQYFTSEGKYPEDLGRNLQKLSKRIYDNDSANRIKPAITKL